MQISYISRAKSHVSFRYSNNSFKSEALFGIDMLIFYG
jgi:hypothetical protein